MKYFMLTAILPLLGLTQEAGTQPSYRVQSTRMEIRLSPNGEITEIRRRGDSWSKHMRGETSLDSCIQTGKARVENTGDGGVWYRREFLSAGGIRLSVTDRFTPEDSTIRWDAEIEGGSQPWSTGIETRLMFPDTLGRRFWTAWGDPDQLSPIEKGEHPDEWHTPFETRPFRAMHLLYGGHFAKGGGYSVPIFSVMYAQQNTGITLAMSPGDPLLDVHMVTGAAGEVILQRNFNRLEKGKPVRFTMHICLPEADWRSVMSFMVDRYPAYFHAQAAHALDVCGLGAYSSYEGEIDAEKYRKMGGIVNWKASFDFSYMGMFIPPVPSDTTPWKRFDATSGGEPIPGQITYTTIARMAAYARRMKTLGFSTLNYFNVTEFGGFSEFGNAVAYPDPHARGAEDVWRNPSAFLYDNFPGAIVFGVVDDKGWNFRSAGQLMHMNVTFVDHPYRTWGGAIILDAGDTAYARFLLKQARLHVQKFPDAQGIAIDRLDWFNEYNWHADDGRTWVGGRAVRSLLNSYREFIPRLSDILHERGKVVFCNPHMSRVDLMKWIDGVYSEFGHIGHDLNLASFLTFYKPLICWTPDKATVMKSPDAYFQRHLLMGAFPTAPFPGNDHTIGPDTEVERYYLDYGHMFTLLHGRTWVLLPGVAEVADGKALCNVFQTKTAVLVPVVMGTSDTVRVRIRHCAELGITPGFHVETWHPGEEAPSSVQAAPAGDELALTAQLVRHCAFLVLRR